ncbi:DNA repair protein RAD5 [Diaporthe helianthi]|uniref:DNA repair protein RAD5 n=1 Tax=Diaporthe helianthi TaxID=158607 RepID=A0A2P5I934_DIAHE|nr:DNA repair protein RAD5 [Diaporthe helianthi]
MTSDFVNLHTRSPEILDLRLAKHLGANMERQKPGLQGSLARFARAVQVACGKDPRNYTQVVRCLLKDAKEVVEIYEAIALTFGKDAVEQRQQSTSSQDPDINFRRSSALFATPVVLALGSPANASPAISRTIPPSGSFLSLTSSSAPRNLPSKEVFPSTHKQFFQDDGPRDDVQNLVVLSEMNIPPSKRRHTPKQMACDLTEHQRIGLTFLLQQENDRNKKGCLLADGMGLGKTIQAMALITAHPSKDPKHKTTLIVAPLALLRQWEKEIQTKIKSKYKLSTFVFHGQATKDVTVSELLQYDVVLCTYAKLQIEFKNKHEHKKPMKVKLLAEKTRFHRVILDEAHNIRNQGTYCSKAAAEIKSEYRLCMTGTPFMNRAEEIFPLIRFLRIPPYNKWERFSEEIVRPLRKWDGDGKDNAMLKLQALFRSFTLRRTKDSRLDGKPIFELPPRLDQPSYVKFNDEQREFYQALEVQQQLKFNKYLINGAVMKNYMHILILLLRLRQACDHPFLLKNIGIPEGAKLDDKQMVRLACKLPAEVLQRLKKQKCFLCPLCDTATDNPVIVVACGHHVCSGCFSLGMAAVETEGFTDDRDDNVSGARKKPTVPCPGGGCEHSITPTNIVCYNFLSDVPDSAFDSDNDEAEEGHPVPTAELPPSSPFGDQSHYNSNEEDDDDEEDADEYGNLRGFVLSPDDELCIISSDEEEDLDDGDQDGQGVDEDHGAGSNGGNASSLVDLGFLQTDGAFDDFRASQDIRKPKRKSSTATLGGRITKKSRDTMASSSGKSKRGRDPDNMNKKKKKKKVMTMAVQRQAAQRSSIAMSRYKARLRKDWISSAKIDAIMEILWRIRPGGEKTLVFSLWTSFLDLVEVPVEQAGLRFTRYDGSMTPGAREAAVKSFMEDPGVEVMLVSLTAGNAGLNLTAASQVIVAEPFWNPFVEEQAIDRAHRFGQKRPVVVHRLLIPGTVEDRIVALQDSKKMLVDAALSEKGAANVSRLNVAELRGLFGL